MSIKDFPSIQYVSVLENDSDMMKLATWIPTESFQLQKVMIKLYLEGNFPNESQKLRLHSSDYYGINFAESNTIELDNAGTNFLGWVTFDFNREELYSGFTYQLTAISNGYTRNADLKYISFVHDWPLRFYSSTNIVYQYIPSKYPKAMQIFGRQA